MLVLAKKVYYTQGQHSRNMVRMLTWEAEREEGQTRKNLKPTEGTDTSSRSAREANRSHGQDFTLEGPLRTGDKGLKR